MTTSVVTGGSGFLGSHLCEALLARGHRVLCLDNLDTGTLENIEHLRDDGFEFRNLECSEFIDVAEPVHFVFHLASPASPIDYLRLPLHTLKVGSYGTHNALGLAKFKRARFLLASTSEVYGDPLVHPQPESYWGNVNPIGPRGVYDEAKRYAEAMTMAYHRQQGVDTSIARIFNSVLADEQVLYDDGRELRRETAAQLAARLVRRAVPAGYMARSTLLSPALLQRAPVPAVEHPLQGYTVPAFDSSGRASASEAVSFVGHPTRQRCFRVCTRYGRSVKVTGDHSLYVEGTAGTPVPKPVAEMKVGERVAIAGKIQVPERDRRVIDMTEVWHWAEEDQWNLYVEAPGLGETAWEHRFDVFGCLASVKPGKGQVWRNGLWTRIIRMRRNDRVPLPIMRALGHPVPDGAKVRMRTAGKSAPMPAKIEVNNEVLWLLGLYVAEGCMHGRANDAFVTISGDEAMCARAARVISRTFGLHVIAGAASPDRSASIFVHSRLFLRVLDFLGFGENGKRIPGWILSLPLSRLKWFMEGYREGDGVHSGKKFEEGVRHEFSTVHEELKDDLIVTFARFGLVPSVGRYESTLRHKTGDRRYPFWRLTLPKVDPWSPLEWDQDVRQTLNARRHGDLVWAAITSIEEVPATDLVFDFSVPGLENFWAGGGLMAKNTYGPRMRPNDGRAIPTFLKQALDEKPLTVFGDGTQTRSFCYVDDLIDGLIRLAESGEHDPVNLGNPAEYTLLQLAQEILKVTGSASRIVFEALPIDDPRVRQPDITRARTLLGWEPSTPLPQGLRRVLDYETTRPPQHGRPVPPQPR